MKFLIGVLALGVLAGCATSSIPVGDAQQAPKSQLLAFQQRPLGDYGTVQVVRDTGHTGSMCSMAVFIDGAKVALLDPGQKAAFYLPPGQITIGAAYSGSGICSMGADRIERDASAPKGAVKNYRVSTGSDGKIDILPTTL